MEIIWMLLIGLVAGFLARAIVPGRDPMGFVATIVLGVVGAIVGGLVARALGDEDGVGIIGAVLGAVVVLLAWNAFVRNRRGGVRGMGRRMTT